MPEVVKIKGVSDGLLITLGEGEWEEVRQAMLAHLDAQADFLRGAKFAVDVGARSLKATQVGQLQKDFAHRELALWAILSQSPLTEKNAQSFGLATRLNKPVIESSQIVETRLSKGEEAVLIRRTLRSGFRLMHQGHVVVIGDVNPGAEIVAAGDIVVWGRLRGMVHAGAEGNEDAVICALDLSPTQLRIADHVALTPKRRGKPQPEMARLVGGQVVAEPWEAKKEKI